MKKLFKPLSLFTIAFLLASPAQAAKERIGVIAGSTALVDVKRGDAIKKYRSGSSIYEGDVIRNNSSKGLQLIMMDETVFTLGKGSEFSLDRYEFNQASKSGSLQVSLNKGSMKFSSGHISNGDPDNFQILLPNDNKIGVRGTIGLILIDTSGTQLQSIQNTPAGYNEPLPNSGGTPNQPVVFAALSGPGPISSGTASGSFNFSSPNGSVDLNRPGGSVLATPGQPPVFFIAPPGAISAVGSTVSVGTTNVASSTSSASQTASTPVATSSNGESSATTGTSSDSASSSNSETNTATSGSSNSGSSSGGTSAGTIGGRSGVGGGVGAAGAGAGYGAGAAGYGAGAGVSSFAASGTLGSVASAGLAATVGAVAIDSSAHSHTHTYCDNSGCIFDEGLESGFSDDFLPDNVVDEADLNEQMGSDAITLSNFVAANSGVAMGSAMYTGDITGNFDFVFDFSNRLFDVQSYNLNGGGLTNDSIDTAGGGSDTLPNDSRTTLTIGNNGEDFNANVSGNCANCSVTVDFPTTGTVNGTITNGAFTGTTGETSF